MDTAIAGETKTKAKKPKQPKKEEQTTMTNPTTSMKVNCSREDLLKAFGVTASVAPARSTKEILTNIRMSATPEGVRLHATDMEATIAMTPTDCIVESAGDVLLPAQRTLAILRESSDDDVIIEAVGTEIVLTTQMSVFKLPSANPAEYPSNIETIDAEHFEISAKLLVEGLKRTAFATDADSSRYALGGVKLELTEAGEVFIVATDGRRLAAVSGKGESRLKHCTPTNASTIIPQKTVQLILRAFNSEGEAIKVFVSANIVAFQQGDVLINTRLVEGTYPNWRRVIPEHDTWTFKESIAAGSFGGIVSLPLVSTDRGIVAQHPSIARVMDSGASPLDWVDAILEDLDNADETCRRVERAQQLTRELYGYDVFAQRWNELLLEIGS